MPGDDHDTFTGMDGCVRPLNKQRLFHRSSIKHKAMQKASRGEGIYSDSGGQGFAVVYLPP